jgi:hypothetical protein
MTEGDATLTILAHATRSENPVAELQAYQELQRAGMSEEQIARAGYATPRWTHFTVKYTACGAVQRIRKIAKLNRLIPEIAARVEKGEIAPGVAFQIAKMAPEIQHELVEEEKITGPVVREYRYAQRQVLQLHQDRQSSSPSPAWSRSSRPHPKPPSKRCWRCSRMTR